MGKEVFLKADIFLFLPDRMTFNHICPETRLLDPTFFLKKKQKINLPLIRKLIWFYLKLKQLASYSIVQHAWTVLSIILDNIIKEHMREGETSLRQSLITGDIINYPARNISQAPLITSEHSDVATLTVIRWFTYIVGGTCVAYWFL